MREEGSGDEISFDATLEQTHHQCHSRVSIEDTSEEETFFLLLLLLVVHVSTLGVKSIPVACEMEKR